MQRVGVSLATPEDVIAELASARTAFESDKNLSCILLPASPFLSRLRHLGGDELSREGDRVLLGSDRDARCATSGCVSLASELTHILGSAFEDWCARAILTRRPWLYAPCFHVDEAAATLIVPIENAPTHVSRGDFREHRSGTVIPPTELHIRMRPAYASEAEVEITDPCDLVFMKGLQWRPGDAALVHSPPNSNRGRLDPGHGQAIAIIVELERAR
jgi:hypothetical protein